MTKKQKRFSIIFFVLLGVMFYILFNFSAQNGENSTSLSNNVTSFILKIFNNDFETISIEQQTLILETFSSIIRKTAHFTVFFMIGILSYFAVYMFKIKQRYKYLLVAGICIFNAVFDECHQYFVPQRTASINDVLIDLSGSFFGILLIIATSLFVNYVKATENRT